MGAIADLTVINNVTEVFKLLVPFLTAVAVFLGIWFFVSAMKGLLEANRNGTAGANINNVFTQLLIASFLVTTPWFVDVAQETIFGNDRGGNIQAISNLISYTGMGGADAQVLAATSKMVYATLFVVGYIATIRGLKIFYLVSSPSSAGMSALEKSSKISSAFWHIVGGQLAINVGPLIKMILGVFGVDIDSPFN